jgi:hypothetical protein
MQFIQIDFSFTRLIFDLKIPLSGSRQTKTTSAVPRNPRVAAQSTQPGDSHVQCFYETS